MKKAFTLLELLIVLVVVGILASISLPKFTSTVERAKADQAANYLRVIRTGEKIYYANNYTYLACAGHIAIQASLGAEITEENYTFGVTSAAATTFFATATRKTDNKTITLDQDYNWSGSSPYVSSVSKH